MPPDQPIDAQSVINELADQIRELSLQIAILRAIAKTPSVEIQGQTTTGDYPPNDVLA